MERFEFDPSLLEYEDFIKYFFTAPVDAFWDVDPEGVRFVMPVVVRPDVVVRHLTRLCDEFSEIARTIALESLDHAIDGMLSEANFSLQSALWNNTVDLGERIRCIRSMYGVFANFVAESKAEVLPGCFFMWWDHICSSFWFEQTYKRKLPAKDYTRLGDQDRALVDAMFETLARTLKVDDDRTRSCALHGLGHLHHPTVRETVQRYIDDNRAASTSEGLRWLEECRDGTVM
ncbi:MAG TPA: hypothetical protein VFW94_15715 [Candidatus Acidoferrales bacterium]|nr:hypothetical protein [Candidatus Acidoferrales bacterium]